MKIIGGVDLRFAKFFLVLSTLGFYLAQQRAVADNLLSTTSLYYNGGSQPYTVPSSANYLIIKAWGGGGGGGFYTYGGGGQFVQARLSVSAGQQLSIDIGGGGRTGDGNSWYGVSDPYYEVHNGGGDAWVTGSAGMGGGYTIVNAPDGSILVAGGGGGG